MSNDRISVAHLRALRRGVWPDAPADRFVLALAILMPWLALGVPPLFDLDEGAFTAATLEMFLRSDFISISLLGEPRHDKPILIHWLQAAATALLGSSTWSYRMPSALASSVWVGLTYAFVARVMDRVSGVNAALLLATSLGLVIVMRAATADAVLHLCLAAAGYAIWLWIVEDRALWRRLAILAMGLGFLVKGPVAVVIPLGTLMLWGALSGQMRRGVDWLRDGWGMLLFVAVASPWFVVQVLVADAGFLRGFFLDHNLARFASPREGHSGGYLYYLPVLVLSLLPHSGLLIPVLIRLRTFWRDPLLRYALVWFALVFVLFSFSGTKLPHYVYYGYGGLIVLMAAALATCRWRPLLLLPGGVFLLVLALLPEGLAWLLPHVRLKPDDRALIAEFGPAFSGAYTVAMTLGLLTVLGLLFARRVPLARAVQLQGLLAASLVTVFLLPAVGEVQQGPVQRGGRFAAGLDAPLVLYGVNTPSLQTYARRQVLRRPPRAGDLVWTRDSRVSEFPGARVLFRERSYVLLHLP